MRQASHSSDELPTRPTSSGPKNLHPDKIWDLAAETLGRLQSKGCKEGDLLHKVSGYGETKMGASESEWAQQAIAMLDAWDEPTFRIARAALERLHPEQAAFVFANLESATGAAAVLSVKTFLERLDDLDKAPRAFST